jgi:hypothetical protein
MVSDLPTVMEYDESPDRVRQDLLDRLHWNVFGPLGEVSVQDGTILTPLSSHAIRFESVADPPISRVTVEINVCFVKHAMDETEEEEDRYQSPEPLIIEKLDGSPISLNDFVTQVHPFLNANKDEIFKCEDEFYTQPTGLEDGTKFVGFGPDDFVSLDGDEGKFVESSHFLRSGNIPADARFFFDRAQLNVIDTDEFEVYVDLFVEGNMATSFEQFWAQRARA